LGTHGRLKVWRAPYLALPGPPPLPKRAPPVIVESQVRTSPRLKHTNKGFKANTYSHRKCLACGPNPPMLNKDVIKKIGIGLLQIR
jgi:hypothetical protein